MHCDSLPHLTVTTSSSGDVFCADERTLEAGSAKAATATATATGTASATATAAAAAKPFLVGTPQERAKWVRDHKLMAKLRNEHIDVDLLFGNPQDLPKPKWRELLLEVLHTSVGQIVLALLIVFDSLLIVGEIIVEVKYLTAEVQYYKTEVIWLENYLVQKTPRVQAQWRDLPIAGDHVEKFLEFLRHEYVEDGSAQHRLVLRATTNRSTGTVDGNSNGSNLTLYLHELETNLLLREQEMHALESVKHAVHITSVVILSVFIVEITLKMICMRMEFFTSKLELLDGAIIWASFLVDIVTLIGNTEAPETSVMIVLLIWRIVRLVNGFLIQEKQRSEAQTEILKQVHQLTLREVTYLRDHQTAKAEFIERLKSACRKLGMQDEEIALLQPIVVLSSDADNNHASSKRAKKISLNLRILSHVTRISVRKGSRRTRTTTSELSETTEETGALSDSVVNSNYSAD